MAEGFSLEKTPEGHKAKFQDIEMVPGGPMPEGENTAIEEIRNSGLLGRWFESSPGFGEFQAVLVPRNGMWPELTDVPPVVRNTFKRALDAERERNPAIDSLRCHMSVRIEGSSISKIATKNQTKRADGTNPEGHGMHFDFVSAPGGLSEYLISFSTPTTVQFLGEAGLQTHETEGPSFIKELNRIAPADLSAVSLLPGQLYHFTNRTPHSRPVAREGQVTNERPRLFMRFMFTDAESAAIFDGVEYRA